MSGRTGWIDAAKGVGIFLVVFGHVERGLNGADIVDDPIWRTIDFYIYTFHMPLFMYLAGGNVPSSLSKPRFLERKAWSILHPYLVWSLIQGGVMGAMSSMTNGEASVWDLLEIGWHPISPFWFLYVLFVYMAVVSFVQPGRGLLVGALAMLCASPFIPETIGFQLYYFFFFFIAGVMFPPRPVRGWVTVGALALCLGWTWTLRASGAPLAGGSGEGGGFYSPLLLPAAIAGIAAMIGLAQRLDFGWIRYLGRNSMSIYVMHILAAAGTRIVLQKVFHVQDPAVHLVVDTLAGLALPLLAFEALRRAGASGLLGLGGGGPLRSRRLSA